MTCVIGLVDNGRVWMGADSLGTDGWGNATVQRTAKVFERAGLLMGYTTSYRFGQILRYAPDMPRHKGKLDERYMVAEFVPWFRKALSEGGWTATENGREDGGNALIGGYGRLFWLGADFSVLEPDRRFASIGTVSAQADGAMMALGGKPERRIRRALRIAADLSSGVGGPFHVLCDGGAG